jgi:RNA polymerase sigma-70 factor (ECF subfamily)
MQVYQPPLQDPEAFSNLYDRTQIIVFRFIYGLHGGPIEDVEDLTGDTFFRAWKGRLHFTGDEHDALCWLFTIARHLVIDVHRRKKRRDEEAMPPLDETNFEIQATSGAESPEEQAATQEQFKHLWSSLQKLADDKREMLVLRYLLGWKVKQIADYMHKEENTVSVSIKRCLEQIRHDWSDEENRR